MKNERKKQVITYILISIGLVLFICGRLLFSGCVTRDYDSLEAAFKYHEGDESEVVLVFEGKESAYVVGDDGSEQTAITFLKKDNCWKDINYPNKLTNYVFSNLRYDIRLSKYNDKDCYISVMVRRQKDANVYDSCGSEFVSLPVSKESTSLYTTGFYAYIEEYDDDYWVNVGDSQITIDQLKKIG